MGSVDIEIAHWGRERAAPPEDDPQPPFIEGFEPFKQ
jgi:hypothetical protein